MFRHPEVAAKRPSKDAAEAPGLSSFEARYARTSGAVNILSVRSIAGCGWNVIPCDR